MMSFGIYFVYERACLLRKKPQRGSCCFETGGKIGMIPNGCLFLVFGFPVLLMLLFVSHMFKSLIPRSKQGVIYWFVYFALSSPSMNAIPLTDLFLQISHLASRPLENQLTKSSQPLHPSSPSSPASPASRSPLFESTSPP